MAKVEMITVICTAPGMIRGGRKNPAIAHYPVDAYTREELLEVVADPNFYVVRGTQLEAESVGTLFDELDAIAAAATKKAAKGSAGA